MSNEFDSSAYEGLDTSIPTQTQEPAQPVQGQSENNQTNQSDFLNDLYEGIDDYGLDNDQTPQPQGPNQPVQQPQKQDNQPQEPTQPKNDNPENMFLKEDGSFDFENFSKFANVPNEQKQTLQQPSEIDQLKAKLKEYEEKLNTPQIQPQQPEKTPSELENIESGFEYVFNLANQYEAQGYSKDQAKQFAMEQIKQQLNLHNQNKTMKEQFESLQKEIQELKSKPDATIQYQKYLDNCTELSAHHGFKSNKTLLDTLVKSESASTSICSIFEAMHPDKAQLKGNDYNNAVLNFLQYEIGPNKQLFNSFVKVAKADLVLKNLPHLQSMMQKNAYANKQNNTSTKTIVGKSVMNNSQPAQKSDPFMAQYKDIFGDDF